MAVPYQPTWAGAYAANPFAGNPNVAQPMQLQQPVNGVIKVNGRDSAMQYALPPNSMSPALFDSGGKMFYIVSTDGAGAKTVETFDYSPHEEEAVAAASYVGREEFDALAKKVQEMMEARDVEVPKPVQPAERHAGDVAGERFGGSEPRSGGR